MLAAVALNRGSDLRRSMSLIKARVPVETAKLRDPDVDLRTLVGASEGLDEGIVELGRIGEATTGLQRSARGGS